MGHCNTWDALGVYVSGSYAYVADGDSGLRIIDVSNPTSPQEVGSYVVPGYAYALGVYGSGPYAYVAYGDSGLRIVDISNPQLPQEVGYYITPGYAYGVFVSDSFAYVADWNYGLRIIKVARPDSTVEVGYYDTPGYASNVYVSDSLVFLADGNAGFEIYKNLLLGVEEGNSPSNGQYVFFPHPLSSQFVVSKEGVYKVEVFDISGRLVYTREGYLGKGTYSIPNLKTGVYFVRVTQGSNSYKVKFVILK